ncbi:MAG: aspartate aminotransferase family protein [Elusimicrobia bacterium]|nr:aspartate aminotransferase family protein [Elusimicrobiota bacterium]
MPFLGPFRYPDSPVHYRRLKRAYPKIVRGEGVWLYDADGKAYLDGSGGAYVASLGHGSTAVAEAMAAQARRFGYVNGTQFTHDAAEEVAQALTALSPGLDKAYLLANGGDAVEAAIKFARQYWAEAGRPEKTKVLSLDPSYHGNTLLALSAGARASYKKLFSDWLVDFPRVPAPYPYRADGDSDPALTGEAFERAVLAAGPDTVAAFIAEPVGGSSTGASVPPERYWKRIRALCDRYQVLLIADEVLCGAGRTGTWSALEPYGVLPDILTLGKGISGGYAPLSAMLAPRRLVDVLARGTGSLAHNQTFSHHPVTCAAGAAALRIMREQRLVERCARLGPALHARLSGLLDHPLVGDVRGRGLLAGIEFVADKKTKKPLPRSLRFSEALADAALERGLVVWPNYGNADGEAGDLVMLAPPFIVTETELDELAVRLTDALNAVTKAVHAGRKT